MKQEGKSRLKFNVMRHRRPKSIAKETTDNPSNRRRYTNPNTDRSLSRQAYDLQRPGDSAIPDFLIFRLKLVKLTATWMDVDNHSGNRPEPNFNIIFRRQDIKSTVNIFGCTRFMR
jgi:hypothetical protein